MLFSYTRKATRKGVAFFSVSICTAVKTFSCFFAAVAGTNIAVCICDFLQRTISLSLRHSWGATLTRAEIIPKKKLRFLYLIRVMPA